MPLIDCTEDFSRAHDLTDIEIQLCESTAGFDDFVIKLLNCCLRLIEKSTSVNNYRLDQENMNWMTAEEIEINYDLKNSLTRVLSEAKPSIFEVNNI